MRMNSMKDHKTAVALMALAAMLGLLTSPARAENECGLGPTVTCAGNYTATGVTYNFNSDLTLTTGVTLMVGANGLRLNGIGDADLTLTVPTRAISGAGGVNVTMGAGHVTAYFDGTGAIATPLSIAGGGGATITLGSTVNPTFPNSRLAAFTADIGGVSTIDITKKRTVTLMTLSPRAGGTMTVSNEGIIGGGSTSAVDQVAIRGAGAGALIVNNTIPRGRIQGNFDLSASTGDFKLLNDNSFQALEGGWNSVGRSVFGSGKVEIRNGTRGVIKTLLDTTFDFSASSNSLLVNEGRLMVGADGFNEATLLLDGLDRFENNGLILLGTKFQGNTDVGLESDGKVKDRLVMTGTEFVAGANSRIALDATLADIAQSDCSAAVSADCVRFVGGSTSGVTRVTVLDAKPLIDHAAFNQGMVLIEGASAAEHFVLDPSSQSYVPHTSAGGVLQKGLVAYRFSYDADAKQHRLIGTLADEGVQASTYVANAQDIWRTTTESWFDRQDMLRKDEGGGFNPHGFWTSLNVANGERDLQRNLAIGGNDVVYNVDQDVQTNHLAFGVDVLRGASGERAWNIGVTAGYVYATVDYDATQLKSTLAGFASGIYGSWLSGPLSVDAMVNLNMMTQSIDAKYLGLGKHSRLRTAVDSLGARADAGWKLAVSQSFWLQPLVSVAYVSTSIGDLELETGGHAVRFSDDKSTRLGLGLRTAVDTRMLGAKAQFMLTGRWWNELTAENETSAYVPNGDSTVAMTDDVSGSFGEVITGMKLFNESGTLSGHVNLKSKFGDDYTSAMASLGLRYNW